ncbi:MAG TPA: flagellar basal body L-ring protein FlgH [Bauldia sp.]|nr:flagellar basal body L-ring protein FlgH [Bauldia sp.]
MRLALAASLAALLALAGCKTDRLASSGPPPGLSPVGSGLTVERTALPRAMTRTMPRTFHSLYTSRDSIFNDLRARRVGDVVTVTIDINDNATFDNETGRTREAAASGKVAAALNAGGFGLGTTSADGDVTGSLDLSSHSKGTGKIDRSEKLHLAIAAVVTEVLPDGNVVISGSQEVRVNNEVRVLNVAGIVRPLDIGRDNVVAYDRIAEARIAYGGRGRLSAVQ